LHLQLDASVLRQPFLAIFSRAMIFNGLDDRILKRLISPRTGCDCSMRRCW